MIDIQSSEDCRGIFLHNVGVKDYLLQASINEQHTLAKIQFGVSLGETQKGIHMSRLCHLLDSFETISNDTVIKILTLGIELLNAKLAKIVIDSTYFRKKTAPVSGIDGTMSYIVRIAASMTDDGSVAIKHSINVPVTAVCPCSKAISNFGAHNQRGIICVTLLGVDVYNYNDIITIIEKNGASCELYSILKREDEKNVTEAAYDNAKFVEDIVRDTVIGLSTHYPDQIDSIECVNYESIHNHNAFAQFSSENI